MSVPTSRPTVTVDAGGRVMIPKALRDRLGIAAGARLRVEEHDGVLELAPEPIEVAVVQRGRVAVLQPTGDVPPPLGADEVRDALERHRR